jgi:hypothetical protein
MLKHYSISRVRLFEILIHFKIEHFSHLGTLFASAFLTEQMANEINLKFPNAVNPM